MILEIETDSGKHQIDVGDVSNSTGDEKTVALNLAMTSAGLDPTDYYLILGEVE